MRQCLVWWPARVCRTCTINRREPRFGNGPQDNRKAYAITRHKTWTNRKTNVFAIRNFCKFHVLWKTWANYAGFLAIYLYCNVRRFKTAHEFCYILSYWINCFKIPTNGQFDTRIDLCSVKGCWCCLQNGILYIISFSVFHKNVFDFIYIWFTNIW